MSVYSTYLFRSPLNESSHINYLSKVLNEHYYGNMPAFNFPGVAKQDNNNANNNRFVNPVNSKMSNREDLFRKKFGRNPRNSYESELQNAMNRR